MDPAPNELKEFEDLAALIQSRYETLSKGQKAVAVCLMSNLSLLCTQTTLQLAEAAGVSNATVVRFAVALGFSGYAELQNCARRALVPQRYIKSIPRGAKLGAPSLEDILADQIDLLKRSHIRISRTDFVRAVAAVAQARAVYVAGIRSVFAPAYFLYSMLNMYLRNTSFLPLLGGYALDELLRAEKHDLLIVFTLARYSKYILEMTRLASARGVPILIITDNVLSPAGRLAGMHLEVSADSATVPGSALGLMSLMEALLSAVAAVPGLERTIRSNLNTFEEWVAPSVFLDTFKT